MKASLGEVVGVKRLGCWIRLIVNDDDFVPLNAKTAPARPGRLLIYDEIGCGDRI